MKIILNDELIERILSGNISQQELDGLRQVLKTDSPEHDRLRTLLEKYWEKAEELKDLPERDSQAQLNIIHAKLGLSQVPEKKQIIPVRRTFPWLKVAAVLIPLIILGSAAYFVILKRSPTLISIEAPSGIRLHRIMADGTEIWLNSNSRLSYTSLYGKKVREVKLSGEAYFNVKPDKSHPFIVRASEIQIKVLGTSFNVSAYPSDTYIETTLEKGQIEYSDGTNGNIYLSPGEQAVYSVSDKKLNVRQVQTNQYGSWRNNQLQFRNAELSFVLKSMEHWYGVKFNVQDSEILKLHFTATIRNESLDQVMGLLGESIEIKYTKNGNIISLSKSKD